MCCLWGTREDTKSSLALLCLLMNLLNSGLWGLFVCLLVCLTVCLFFSQAVWYCLQSSGKIKQPFSQLLNIGHCLRRMMNPSAQLSAAVHHPARAEVRCKWPWAMYQQHLAKTSNNVNPLSPDAIQQATGDRDGSGAVFNCFVFESTPKFNLVECLQP